MPEGLLGNVTNLLKTILVLSASLHNPSVTLTGDSSLYTREPWVLPHQYAKYTFCCYKILRSVF